MVIVLFSFTFDPTYNGGSVPGLLWLAFSLCSVAHVATLFSTQTKQRHPERLTLIRQRSLRHFSRQARRDTLFLLFTEVLMLPVFAIYNACRCCAYSANYYWFFFWAAWAFPSLAPRFPQFPPGPDARTVLPLLLLPFLLTPVLVASTQVTLGLSDASPSNGKVSPPR